MGKRSVRENKNVYQLAREAAGLSREAAGERMVFVSPDRVERIESGRSAPHPDEVLSMERCYRAPELSNYYCTHECPIGMKYVPEAKLRELPHAAMELLAALGALGGEKDRLIAIAADAQVSEDERAAFGEIVEKLTRLETAIRAMSIWIEHDAAGD
jgi:transcriptional regulator with XRE-family HTH domain